MVHIKFFTDILSITFRFNSECINCHPTSISQYVDHHLQPHIKELKSNVKDSTDFIKQNDLHKIPKDRILVAMDVRSLYTNIPLKEGIKAGETILKRKTKPRRVVVTFLKLIPTLNNFISNCKNYLQIKGCAMGTKRANTYANIFWECLKKTTFTI